MRDTAEPPPLLNPGWREIATGLTAFAAVMVGGGAAILAAGLNPMESGLVLTSLSGVAGLVGFAAAFASIRSLEALGVRATSGRWITIGLAVGLLAFLLKAVFVMGFIALTGQQETPQAVYAAGGEGEGGVWRAIAATLLLGGFAPIGEELLFRGVVTNALLRYGPMVGVVGGATVFAVAHGLNLILPAAVAAGLAAGEVFRRSGSVWPAVAVHMMFNLPTIPLMLLASASR